MVVDRAGIITLKASQGIKRLFKNYLDEFDALVDEHDDAMKKLHEALPPEYKEYVRLADYINDVKIENMRRKVLSAGNDAIRDIEETIKNLRV